MGSKAKKSRAKRSVKSGVKNALRTQSNQEILNRLIKELKNNRIFAN
jgi:hypothetical protein